jgi:hypothetical protein
LQTPGICDSCFIVSLVSSTRIGDLTIKRGGVQKKWRASCEKKPETLIQWLLQGTSYMKAGNGTWISQLFIWVS